MSVQAYSIPRLFFSGSHGGMHISSHLLKNLLGREDVLSPDPIGCPLLYQHNCVGPKWSGCQFTDTQFIEARLNSAPFEVQFICLRKSLRMHCILPLVNTKPLLRYRMWFVTILQYQNLVIPPTYTRIYTEVLKGHIFGAVTYWSWTLRMIHIRLFCEENIASSMPLAEVVRHG